MEDDTCAVDGCNKVRALASRSKNCAMHNWRMRKHGSFDLPQRGPCIDLGYHRRGRTWVHREVLLAVIGPEPHPCHWCNRMLRWGVDLQTDHVDFDRLNNDPHNLVPSCARCNIARSVRRRAEAQTRCREGHEFTPENTYINATSGARTCRKCRSGYQKAWTLRNPDYSPPKRPAQRTALAERRIARFSELGSTWEALERLSAEWGLPRDHVVGYLRSHGVKLPDGRQVSPTRAKTGQGMQSATCRVPGCEKLRRPGMTLCSMHRARLGRTGSLDLVKAR